jgi:hypothetical protein
MAKFFRWQRGGLDESLKTTVEVCTLEELFARMQATDGPLAPATPQDIRVEPYDALPDPKIGWPATYAVSVRVAEPDTWALVGFADGPLR